ncbi:hypothetical protein [Haloarchaeobius sp. HRN-SO-5]|uniref:hypothetical protein n=1 Tax=Haloarchaeobius sp. HRN-SO-5 TaxID=3446118 RepID=UPI003EB918DC
MDRDTYVSLSFLAFGLLVASFVVLGLGRVAFGYRTAQLLSAPIGLTAFGLFLVLLADGVRTTVRRRIGE